MYKGSFPEEDVKRDAEYLGITTEQFIDFFLEKAEFDVGYQTKHTPCDFLMEDGREFKIKRRATHHGLICQMVRNPSLACIIARKK